jgi:hypothetical protein
MGKGYQTAIYTTPPAADGFQSLVVGDGGVLDVSEASGVLGLPPAPPEAEVSTIQYVLQVTHEGVVSWVEA